MIFFSSDWHIGHQKNFLYEPRGFSSIEEHDAQILKNCNEIVKPEDELWLLGDLVMGKDKKEWDSVFLNLNCQNIHYLQGNHETDNKMDIYDMEYKFEYHGYADIFKYSKRCIFYLCHYPTIVDNFKDGRPSMWCLSGHTHSKNKFYDSYPNVYNVSLDAHNNYPVSIEDIIKDIKQKEKEFYNG